MSLYDRIPNNVNLAEDQRLQRALENWLPNYLDWWRDGAQRFSTKGCLFAHRNQRRAGWLGAFRLCKDA